jgi:hypothetical protein
VISQVTGVGVEECKNLLKKGCHGRNLPRPIIAWGISRGIDLEIVVDKFVNHGTISSARRSGGIGRRATFRA